MFYNCLVIFWINQFGCIFLTADILNLLQKIGRDQIFKNTFQGIYSDQKICKDCPHRWVRVK